MRDRFNRVIYVGKAAICEARCVVLHALENRGRRY